jgi:hypothetical protein
LCITANRIAQFPERVIADFAKCPTDVWRANQKILLVRAKKPQQNRFV